ncbi:3-oxoacyl-[acyl-carrier-protein] reductase FabG-like [Danaus plexippus]|uniref:3-oxoacyl-[acyl-carrier-protein] reductase FabG-like n=1 Tax=Danaus plexippus TaxID=13037 RepID=UPI002AB17495|nr:3-oxoacyl-[acyl-carrier-protein] reductase FabG-like [Danaus plexippus]
MSFSDKVVIVTGASSGIGAATALLFSKEKANVVIVGRNEAKLKVVTAQCEEVGNKPLVIRADVSDDDEAARIINETIEKYGKLDVLVNNAGFVRGGSLMDGKILQAYDDLIDTNLRAVICLTQLATPHLIKSRGNIINISSVAGGKTLRSNYFLAYGISKAGLNFFSQGAATELAEHGVRVNVISPGPVVSDIFENSKLDSDFIKNYKINTMGDRISSSEEVGHMILYLASDKAAGMTGSNYILDNGYCLLN